MNFDKKCKHLYIESPIIGHEQEEWGGWKFVSDMLDNPVNGIYPTSKCYEQLYDFVMEQKAKARTSALTELLESLEANYSAIWRIGCDLGKEAMLPAKTQ